MKKQKELFVKVFHFPQEYGRAMLQKKLKKCAEIEKLKCSIHRILSVILPFSLKFIKTVVLLGWVAFQSCCENRS